MRERRKFTLGVNPCFFVCLSFWDIQAQGGILKSPKSLLDIDHLGRVYIYIARNVVFFVAAFHISAGPYIPLALKQWIWII